MSEVRRTGRGESERDGKIYIYWAIEIRSFAQNELKATHDETDTWSEGSGCAAATKGGEKQGRKKYYRKLNLFWLLLLIKLKRQQPTTKGHINSVVFAISEREQQYSIFPSAQKHIHRLNRLKVSVARTGTFARPNRIRIRITIRSLIVLLCCCRRRRIYRIAHAPVLTRTALSAAENTLNNRRSDGRNRTSNEISSEQQWICLILNRVYRLLFLSAAVPLAGDALIHLHRLHSKAPNERLCVLCFRRFLPLRYSFSLRDCESLAPRPDREIFGEKSARNGGDSDDNKATADNTAIGQG